MFGHIHPLALFRAVASTAALRSPAHSGARRLRRLAAILALTLVPLGLGGLVDLSAPLTDVSATYNGSQVVCRMVDPAQGKEYVDTTPAFGLYGFSNTDGVVSWATSAGVFIRTYDPGLTNWARFDQAWSQPQAVLSHRGLVAWRTANAVAYVAYDRARKAWLGDAEASTTFDLRCVDGVVAWTTPNGVYCRTYDPALGYWVKNNNVLGATYNLATTNGVVAWSNGANARARIYDPIRHGWVHDDTPTAANLSLMNDSGAVAFNTGSSLYARLYDSRAGLWQAAVAVPPSRTTILLGITNGTITWSDGFNVSRFGFNFGTTNWHGSPTTPLAGFGLSTNAGAPPLTVHFTDASVGGIAHAWNFGDGGTAATRSPSHTFRTIGRFTVVQTVVGQGGSVTATNTILTDLEAPAGSIVINGGATSTTNATLTLTLGAADNSGTVASMRFSNDGTTWSAWEPYATNKSWPVAPGVTTRIVRAQFQDPFGNVSAVVQDSIFVDTTPPPPVRFALLSTNVVENTVNLSFAVNLDYPMTREVRVDYQTQDGTATAGPDYDAASGTLIFASGSTNRFLTIRVLEDTAVELDETFQVVLTNGLDTIPGAPLTIGILDDDPPQVRLSADRFSAGEGDGNAVLNAILSAPSGMAVSVNFVATNGTATAGLDYVALTGTLSFNPGQTSRTLAIPLLDDALDEFTETIEVRLVSPTNAVLATPSLAVVDILDNDPPTVSFAAARYTADEDAGSVVLEVRLTKPSTQTVFVDCATIGGGTATAGKDYVAASSTLIFAPGQTNRTFQVNLLADTEGEPTETLVAGLSGFVNVLPGNPLQATVELLDNDTIALAALGYGPASGFRLGIAGPAGGRVRIERSADLLDWHFLATVDNPDGTVEYVDADTTPATRYYRARSAP